MSATAHARSAVIDVGSNTIHLLVGEVENGVVLPVTGEKVSARLGSGVDKTGKIEEARIPVAVEAIGLFARLAALNNVSETAVLATSAVRDAKNGPTLCEGVREKVGLEVRMISGKEEALQGPAHPGATEGACGGDFGEDVRGPGAGRGAGARAGAGDAGGDHHARRHTRAVRQARARRSPRWDQRRRHLDDGRRVV